MCIAWMKLYLVISMFPPKNQFLGDWSKCNCLEMTQSQALISEIITLNAWIIQLECNQLVHLFDNQVKFFHQIFSHQKIWYLIPENKDTNYINFRFFVVENLKEFRFFYTYIYFFWNLAGTLGSYCLSQGAGLKSIILIF